MIIHVLIFTCSVGYFVQPTIYQTTNPKNKLMQEVSIVVAQQDILPSRASYH